MVSPEVSSWIYDYLRIHFQSHHQTRWERLRPLRTLLQRNQWRSIPVSSWNPPLRLTFGNDDLFVHRRLMSNPYFIQSNRLDQRIFTVFSVTTTRTAHNGSSTQKTEDRNKESEELILLRIYYFSPIRKRWIVTESKWTSKRVVNLWQLWRSLCHDPYRFTVMILMVSSYPFYGLYSFTVNGKTEIKCQKVR